MQTTNNRRATKKVVSLTRLKKNVDHIRRLLGAGRQICAAVKANAYGHGLVEIGCALQKMGVERLGVATVSEGARLRQYGINVPILLFGIADAAEFPELAAHSLQPFIANSRYLERLIRFAFHNERQLSVHLKIDTGMGRIGLPPAEAISVAKTIGNTPQLTLAGVCTHFAVSDSLAKDDIIYTREQIKLFDQTIDSLKQAGINPGVIHAANSGAIVAHREAAYDMARPGISLYAGYPSVQFDDDAKLQPIMRFITEVAMIKKVAAGQSVSYGRLFSAPRQCFIATLPVGYADGYSRGLSNNSEVLINGRLYPVAGRVCMDQMMVNLGENRHNVAEGDEVVLYGWRPNEPRVAALAAKIGTIAHDLLCAPGSERVPLFYEQDS